MSARFKQHTAKPAKLAPRGVRATKTKPAEAANSKAEYDGAADTAEKRPKEIGGPSGPEPTRYGDWEVKGRCIDF